MTPLQKTRTIPFGCVGLTGADVSAEAEEVLD